MISTDQISRASAMISVLRGDAAPSAIRRRVRAEAQEWADYRGSPVAVVHVQSNAKKSVPLERVGTADLLEDVFFPRWDPYDRADLPPGGAGCCTGLTYPWWLLATPGGGLLEVQEGDL